MGQNFNNKDIKIKLTTVFQDIFEEPNLQIEVLTTANDIDKWDSMTHLLLIESIEQAFDIFFSFQEVRSFENVGNMVDAISQKVNI